MTVATTNQPSHTGGPWEADKSYISAEGDFLIFAPEDRDCYVAKVPVRECGDKEIARANARLIAAAPELLDALRGLLDCPDIADNDYKDEATHTAERMARAAIAKAEGR